MAFLFKTQLKAYVFCAGIDFLKTHVHYPFLRPWLCYSTIQIILLLLSIIIIILFYSF